MAEPAAEVLSRTGFPVPPSCCCGCCLHASAHSSATASVRASERLKPSFWPPTPPHPPLPTAATPPPQTHTQVLDHHKTAAAELTDPSLAQSCPSLEVVFDMERSGATIRCACDGAQESCRGVLSRELR